ncbi:MAG TPA: cytochrome c biogenesis protein CcsA [Terriglobales bacterium]|nr:cytochrome c biogenesis protein CcsA [Terriglobales bacterium]
MPLLWLRIAIAFYAVGLVYALTVLVRRTPLLARITPPAMVFGMVFHFVAVVETASETHHVAPTTVHDVESWLAFLMVALFAAVYARYRTLGPGLFVFPLVFVLALAASVGKQPPEFSSPVLRSGWIVLHIALVFAGYAALFLSFAASFLYLVSERGLKSKKPGGLASRLPPLEVIDEIGYRSLLLGFPVMTFGLIAGAVIAQAEFGPGFFRDPKIVLSLLTWVLYMVLLYTRWSAGWRGRRAAVLSAVAFVAAAAAFAANYFSGVHRFVAQ